jgi:uncharacterized membrane protein YfcA
VTSLHALIILVSAVAAGTINTVVGSGSLITFPTLIALGYPPVLANVSNNIGLVPGGVSGTYGYRRELEGQSGRLLRLLPASIAGGLIGAILLLQLPSAVFKRVVVILIVLAVILVVLQPALSRRVAARHVHRQGGVGPVLLAIVFGIGVYGGYFGAAQGIILIAVLGIFLIDDLQRLNGCKNALVVAVNGTAAIVFVLTTSVDWKVVGLIAVGSTVGGQVGASVGRRLDPRVLRAVIVAVGAIAVARLV